MQYLENSSVKSEEFVFNRQGDIMGMIGNCGAKYRTDYLQELMKHIPIDQFGTCLNNKPIQNKRTSPRWQFDKSLVMKGYKIGLALENKKHVDYVTEKIYDVLLVGSIPIYAGASNIDEYVPKHSYIDVSDFPNPVALAKYLKQVVSNKTLFRSYKRWTFSDVEKIFHRLRCKESWLCQFCDHVINQPKRLVKDALLS